MNVNSFMAVDLKHGIHKQYLSSLFSYSRPVICRLACQCLYHFLIFYLQLELFRSFQLVVDVIAHFLESLELIANMKQEIMGKETEIQVIEKRMKGIEKQLKQSERTRLDLSHKVWSLFTDLSFSFLLK